MRRNFIAHQPQSSSPLSSPAQVIYQEFDDIRRNKDSHRLAAWIAAAAWTCLSLFINRMLNHAKNQAHAVNDEHGANGILVLADKRALALEDVFVKHHNASFLHSNIVVVIIHSKIRHSVGKFQHVLLFPRLQVIHFHWLVVAGTKQKVIVNQQMIDCSRMGFDCGPQTPRTKLPDANVAVAMPGCKRGWRELCDWIHDRRDGMCKQLELAHWRRFIK